MIASRSSTSLAREGAKAELEGMDIDDMSPLKDSPMKRKKVINMLAREMKKGGRATRIGGSSSTPMLLPAIKREECQF